MRVSLIRVFAALCVLGGALPIRASAQASLYVPLDDIAYQYVDALIARGALRNMSMLERPYPARALSIGADSVLQTSTSAVIRSYALALQTALARYGDGIAYPVTNLGIFAGNISNIYVNGDVFSTAQTSGIRDLMQADSAHSVTGGAELRMAATAGPLVMMLRPVLDNRLNNDPQFGGRKDRSLAGRTEDAYVSGQWQYAQLFLGRIGRNWGPYPMDGLELGHSTYSYDHLYARFGTSRLHVSSLVAKLDDDVQPDGVHTRYFYTHRIDGRWKMLEVSVNESYLATGVGRSYELSMINPLNLYSLSWRNENADDGNLSFGGDIALRTYTSGTYAAEFFLDDVQVDKCKVVCQEPSSYGLTVTAEGIPLLGDQRAFASYTRLTSLAYRTPKEAERYASFGVGLGRAFTDYDETRLGVDLAVIPYATLRAYAAYRRQGQGDYHLPFPSPTQYATTPGFLLGMVEHVRRLALTGGMMIAPGIEVTGDGGYNWARNADHVAGATRSTFEGRIRFQWTPKGWIGTI